MLAVCFRMEILEFEMLPVMAKFDRLMSNNLVAIMSISKSKDDV